jgi:hypothetical protein
MARFLIEDSFAIESRLLFVFAGQIVEGEVRAGTEIRLPVNPLSATNLRVHSVELGNRASVGFVGLTCRVNGREDLDFLRQLDVTGEVVDVIERDAGG